MDNPAIGSVWDTYSDGIGHETRKVHGRVRVIGLEPGWVLVEHIIKGERAWVESVLFTTHYFLEPAQR